MKNTNDGGATPICAAYRMRTCFLPGLTGGFAAVTASMNLFSAGVGTRFLRDAATLSIVRSTYLPLKAGHPLWLSGKKGFSEADPVRLAAALSG